jgi:lysophospholipase L1-like esterase
MIRYTTLLLFATLLLFSSCKKDTTSPGTMPPDSDHKYSYLALGDSYTIGQSVPESDRWGVLLADLLRDKGIDISNPVTIARTGWTTSELANAIASAKPNSNFDMVSLMIGVNNQYRGQSLSAYRTEFKDLLQTSIKLAKNNPKNVLVLSIPDWGATPFAQGRDRQRIAAEIDAFNAAAKEEAQQAGVTFIDVTPLTRQYGNNAAYLASDGLHYSGKMHLEWAKLALPVAQTILK